MTSPSAVDPRSRVARRGDAACALALALGVVLFVGAVFGLGPENDFHRAYDFREIFAHQRQFWRDTLLDGRLPLWNPHTFCGWPFTANPLVQAWYPPALGFLFLPQASAAILDLTAHLVLGAVGMLLLLRRSYGLGRAAASFGALVYATSGHFVGHGFAGHLQFYAASAYTPLLLLAVDRAVDALRRNADAPPESRPAWPLRAGPWLFAGQALLGLAALSGGLPFVWLAMLMVSGLRLGGLLVGTQRSARDGARGRGRDWARELGVLAALSAGGAALSMVQLLPSWELARLCNRTEAGWAYAADGSFPPDLLRLLVLPRSPTPEGVHVWELYGYVGLVPLVFAALALARARSDRRVLVLGVGTVLTVLYMLGEHGFLFPLLWRHVPGFDLFRAPARALAVLNPIEAMLAAIGLQVALERVGRAWSPRALALVTVGLCAIAWADVTLAARANRDRLFLAEAGPTDGEVLRRHRAVLEDDRSWYRFWFRRSMLPQNEAFALGARSVAGYDNMFLRRTSRFLHHMTDTEIEPSLVTILTQRTFAGTPETFPFKVLGVRYADSKQGIAARRGKDAVRRGWFVARARRVADEQGALERIRSDAFDPFGEVLFETPEADRLGLPTAPPPEPTTGERGAGAVAVRVVEHAPERLTVELGEHPAGWLVLSEIWYPGWEASVAGTPLPVLRADSILRSVPLAAGQDRVELRFRPGTQRVGAAISLLALMAVAAGWWLARRAARTAA